MDYTIFYREELPCDDNWDVKWDLFISAFNSSERVNKVYEKINSNNKHWLIIPDYNYSNIEYPKEGHIFHEEENNEALFINKFLEKINVKDINKLSICIDITGFIKPYMMNLIYSLKENGVTSLDIIYSEPDYYANKEKTTFSDTNVYEVMQVKGFAGIHSPNTSKDVLIIGSGYEDELISHVAENKKHCKKIQILGFPSLRPDMYQENMLNVNKASEALGVGVRTYYAPANNPFVVATELSKIFEEENNNGVTNIYLSPLATKPQALGFTLFYLTECKDKPVSMIYPFCDYHSKETSKGISKISKYTIEL